MDQAVQCRSSDPPDTDAKPSTLLPSHSQKTIEPAPVVAQKHLGFQEDHRHDSTPPPTKVSGDSDDEVQFVFAAPRRRKKKRKRIESSHNPAQHHQCTKALAEELLSTPTPPESLRRGTTGMVQRLKSCHIGDLGKKVGPRTGSLPSVPPPINAIPTQKPLTFPSSAKTKLSPRFLPFSPFMSMPWWIDPSLQLQDSGKLRSGRVSVQQGETNKRKRSEEPDQSRPPPAERSLVGQSSPQPTELSGMDGMNTGSLGIINTSPVVSELAEMPSLTPSLQNFSWKPIPNINQTQKLRQIITPASAPINSGSPQQLSPRYKPPHQVGPQDSDPIRSMGQSQTEAHQQQTVRLPAALVPEQSVSPRTLTVEVPKPSSPLQVQPLARQLLTQRSMFQNQMPGKQPRLPMPLNSQQSQIPRSMPAIHPQSVHGPQQQNPPVNCLQNMQTSSSDIRRKPSLYKVPPWPCPSPPPFSNAIHSNITSHGNNSNMGNMASNCGSGIKSSSSSHESNMMYTYPSMPRSPQYVSPYQRRPMPVTPPRTTPLHSQTGSSPPSPSAPPFPTKLQQNLAPGKRTHSPNLIVDIAETCQQNFPFAAVAERHSVPTQKVFDAFSAIIQLPLLRCASDNRRHGELAKRRIKEYKDAKKAMEKAEKEKQQDSIGYATPGSGRGRKKGKEKEKDKGLLKAAILNNARGNPSSGS